jgi:hypothetical protein
LYPVVSFSGLSIFIVIDNRVQKKIKDGQSRETDNSVQKKIKDGQYRETDNRVQMTIKDGQSRETVVGLGLVCPTHLVLCMFCFVFLCLL